ncbi:hypothetical protein CEXT_729921 [Caerostris extrusa]|uniref:Uncharacterized protein n=1 Tax=Caerostris extrusa TaxID=172846 RepID=A0AAV4Q6V9_CAEEX|nr:hypothetical protein CEXT_729921 [Caerostris extrusa]
MFYSHTQARGQAAQKAAEGDAGGTDRGTRDEESRAHEDRGTPTGEEDQRPQAEHPQRFPRGDQNSKPRADSIVIHADQPVAIAARAHAENFRSLSRIERCC